MAKVIIPFPLRKYVDNQAEIDVDMPSLSEAMNVVWDRFPELKATLDDTVLLSIFVNNKMVDATSDQWDSVSLNGDDEVALIIPIAGG